MSCYERIGVITRAYQRNGFLHLDQEDNDGMMGRKVDPSDHPGALGDVNRLYS